MFSGELPPPPPQLMLVTILLSTLVRSSESVVYYHCVHMYICTWWWCLGMLQEVPSMWVTGILVSGWLLEFILHKDNVRFSTLKINGWECNAFRAFRAGAAATCGAEQWALNIFKLQLHTLQMMNSRVRPGNEARVWANMAVRTSRARAAIIVAEQWV